MKQRRAKFIAWGLAGIVVAASVAKLIIWVAALDGAPNLFDLVQGVGWGLAIPATFSVLAALIIARLPDNRVGWLMMIVGLALTSPTGFLLDTLPTPNSLTLGLWLLLWVDGWSWTVTILPIFLIPLHFPTGKVMPGRWKWVLHAAVGLWVSLMVGVALSSNFGPQDGSWSFANPIGFVSDQVANGPILSGFGVVLIGTISASVASLFVRFRHSEGAERQQIRWLLLAGALLVAAYVFIFITGPDNVELTGIQNLVLALSILSIPIAIAVAIFRYRLWDLDVVINRALVYGPLTTLLAGVFAVMIAISSVLARQIFGTQSQALGAAVSAVVVAVIFQPLRARVQAFVDERFYPQKADLASGLVEILPEFWAFLDRHTLIPVAEEHIRAVLGVPFTAFYLAEEGGFELVAHRDTPLGAPPRIELTAKQDEEMRRKRVVASETSGPTVGYVPIHLDRGRAIELTGLIAIGKRTDGRGYSGDELKALADLGGKIGLAMRAIELAEARATPRVGFSGIPALS